MSLFQLYVDKDVAKTIIELYAVAFDEGLAKESADRLMRIIQALWPELIPSYLEGSLHG